MEKFYEFAACPEDTERIHKEEPHEFRDDFHRDRDRILYSSDFRRLSGKTQVFVSGFDDNMRTRLTHTLEVSQIAQTICDALGLNNALCEAIALGHDVGHTPFGHVGERTLNLIMNSCLNYYNYSLGDFQNLGFKHNLQGIRVVTELEKNNDNYRGINLTKYTLWGIVHHSSLKYKKCDEYSESSGKCQYKNCNNYCIKNGKFSLDFYNKYLEYFDEKSDWTLEGIIVGISDEIAQRHHDIEDGFYGKLLDKKELQDTLKNSIAINSSDDIDKIFDGDNRYFLSELSRYVINTYCTAYIQELKEKLKIIKTEFNITETNTFFSNKKKIYTHLDNSPETYFGFSKELKEKDRELSKYLKNCILLSELAQTMDGKASFVIRRLFKAYLSNPQQLPDKTIVRIVEQETNKEEKPSKAREILKERLTDNSAKIRILLLRAICDYIAGMTDQYAMQQFNNLYGSNEMKNNML